MKLIVWDFDGTLVDSRPLIEAGMEHALKGLGLQDRPGLRESWLRSVGLPVEAGLANTFRPLGMDPAEVLKVYRSFDWAGNEHLLRPFPGMEPLLQELRALGIRMAIATSKRSVPVLRQIQGLGWAGWFSPVVTPDDVVLGKPDPESLNRILEETSLDPEDLLMVGDTPFDLDMARGAGVPSLAVGHGFYPEEELLPWGPRAYAPDVPALRDILLAWAPGAEARA
ncbi:MAG: HAD family hydrolase [Acidobacteria bacterium]|nr:HAD family hydrolase [Acidobacteriota bacterium]